MSTAIQKFVNEKFQWKIRIVEINGEPWLVGKDVAFVLGYKDTDQALRIHVPDKFKLTRRINGSGQTRNMTLINEAGLYKLIMRSKLPNAEKFSDWCCGEVLPSIRKTGMYVTEQKKYELINNPDAIIEICNQWKQEIEKNKQLTKENEIMQPKAKYYDEVLNSSSLIPITRIAKEYGLSGQSLNRLLCKWEIQYKQGGVFVLYQDYANEGCAYYEDYPYIDDNGDTQTSQLLKWTQKGREFLHCVLTSNGYNRRKDLRNI